MSIIEQLNDTQKAGLVILLALIFFGFALLFLKAVAAPKIRRWSAYGKKVLNKV